MSEQGKSSHEGANGSSSEEGLALEKGKEPPLTKDEVAPDSGEGARGEREVADAPLSDEAPGGKGASSPTQYGGAMSWKGQLAIGVTAALAAVVFLPIGSWLLGAGDAVRDVARQVVDYDAGKVDALKERMHGRPYWQDEPIALNQSFDLVEADEYNTTATVEDLDVVVVTADELVARALRYDGDPVFVVGRVETTEELPGDSIDLGIGEISIVGAEGAAGLILSLGAGTTSDLSGSFEAGDIIMVRGVLAAYGRRKAADDPLGTPLGYFVVFDDVEVNEFDPRVRPSLRALGVRLPKSEPRRRPAGAGLGNLDGDFLIP